MNWPHCKLGQYCADNVPNIDEHIARQCESIALLLCNTPSFWIDRLSPTCSVSSPCSKNRDLPFINYYGGSTSCPSYIIFFWWQTLSFVLTKSFHHSWRPFLVLTQTQKWHHMIYDPFKLDPPCNMCNMWWLNYRP